MKRNIVVIGASAGGVSALKKLVADLPPDLNAAVFVVLHVGASDPGYLPGILQRYTTLRVEQARDGERIVPGRVWVARPDHHLVLERSVIRLTRSPRENRCRPAVDALFRSAAYAHGSRVIGVVLTGTLDDGSAGLWSIKSRGGIAVVQEPRDSESPSMPRNALLHVDADHVVPILEMGRLLVRLTDEKAGPTVEAASKELELEVQIAKDGGALGVGVMDLGSLTPYKCPECHGVLVELREGVPRFRCHTGHAYSINSLPCPDRLRKSRPPWW